MSEIKSKSFFTKGKILALLVLISLTFVIMVNPFSVNDAGERTVVQPLDGDLHVQFEPGLFYAGFFATNTVWPNNVSIQVSREEMQTEDADLHAPTQMGTFSEGDAATLGHSVKWDLPDDEARMLLLHRAYNNINNLMGTTLLMYQQKIASFSTQRMSSEAHYSGGQSQLDSYFQDQLRNGQVLLVTETKTRKLEDGTEKTYIKVEEIRDASGAIKRSASDIQKYGIIASFSSIDEVKYDPRIYEKLKDKIDAASDEATAKQELITAQQQALTAKAQGEKLIAETKAREESAKLEAVIRAEKEAAVAVENLRRDKSVAESILALKKAEAEGDKLKVSAGLSPLEKARYDKETAIGVAREIAKLQFPEIMVFGGGSGSGSPTNPFDAVGLEAYRQMITGKK